LKLTRENGHPFVQEVPIMGKHRTPYPAEFRAHMVELVKGGRRPEELEKEFEPTAQTIYNWVVQADRDTGVRHDGLTTAERQELTKLRRENRQLKMERDILSQAAAWFARETGAVPPKGGTDS
jgi:transposase